MSCGSLLRLVEKDGELVSPGDCDGDKGVSLIEGDSSRAKRITLCLLALLHQPALPRLNRDTICWLELARSQKKTKHDF
ncbi:hypothetical protein Baya_3228 [Bagarius yarrelli]|uniref:Uncharacterized protein n=1 Tax=Bagarius yarrelli TaxID=175774 RepID=A0A556TS15_BAGYA|nr:hypothetical protein Baya_3228 [Bagarius yarrelli]